MMGKILGVTLVALTQFAIWITMSVVAASIFNKIIRLQLPKMQKIRWLKLEELKKF
jgi:ABC-2 type transport system permease protein